MRRKESTRNRFKSPRREVDFDAPKCPPPEVHDNTNTKTPSMDRVLDSQEETLTKKISQRGNDQSQDSQDTPLAKMLLKCGETYPLDAQGKAFAKMISQHSKGPQPDAQDKTNTKSLYKPRGARS